MNALRAKLNRTISSLLLKRFYREFDLEMRRRRRSVEEGLPKVRIARRHIANCKLLVDRDELLTSLPREGIVAELGVDRGEFSESILRLSSPRKLHLVDPWDTQRYGEELFEVVQRKFATELNSNRVQIHRKLSTEAYLEFEDNYFDWIYIDTDHSYKTTTAELELFAPKVKSHGIIAGHDFVKGNWVSGIRYGVMEAVHEFCLKHDWELLYQTADLVEWSSFAIRRIQRR